MNTIGKIIVLVLIILISSMPALAREKTKDKSDFPVLKGPYLGQKPPGLIPEIFAPGILSSPKDHEYTCSISPDGKEIYFTRGQKILFSKWHKKGYRSHETHVSRNNKKLYFGSWRPVPGKTGYKSTDYGIWYVNRTEKGWSEAQYFGFGMNVSTTLDGKIYLTDIRPPEKNNGLATVKIANNHIVGYNKLTGGMNRPATGRATGRHPCIAPDESFVIFDSYDKEGKGRLYICYREIDGTWSKAFDLGDKINFEDHICASLSPDGKYMFYHADSDIYWVRTEFIEELKSRKLQLSPSGVKLQVLFDNNPYMDDLQTDPGFSCLIKIKNRTLLFDAGRIGKILMSNIEKLEINPADIEKIVISHNHSDHICGLPVLMKECNKPEVYITKAMANNVTDYAQGLIDESIKSAEKHASKVIRTTGPLKISNNVYTTGVMGNRMPEQALIIQTDAGLIVITGCGHPGVVELTRTAKKLLKQDVLLVLGGFHLIGKKPEEIQKIVTDLSNLSRFVAPCHCSGDIARELFKQKFGNYYINAGVGKIIDCGELTKSKKK